ncbi:MAG: hypothetical protein IJ923_03755 [Campylobacter sp.]|nr:hypothetical protein [Campylobacter sp.]
MSLRVSVSERSNPEKNRKLAILKRLTALLDCHEMLRISRNDNGDKSLSLVCNDEFEINYKFKLL